MTAASARRCPASAQRGIPGAPRPAHCRMLAHPPRPKAPDPIGPDAPGAFGASRGGCGARRLEVALERAGIAAPRRRICRIMREDGLSSACSGRAPKGGDRPVRPPSAENVPARPFDGRAPRTRVAAGPACVRAGGSWRCAPARRPLQPRGSRLLVRAAQGRAAGRGRLLERGAPARRHRGLPQRQGAGVLQRGCRRAALGLRNREVGLAPRQPLRQRGRRVDEQGARARAGARAGVPVGGPAEEEIFDWANRCSSCRLHSTLGCMTPAGFREAGLILS